MQIKTKCAFSSCPNDRGKCSDMVFFRFPVDPKRCLKWIINSRRRDLEAVYVNCSDKHFFFRNYIMCAAHFSQCCFMSSECKRLVHNAVPTIFTIDANNPLKFFEPSHEALQFDNNPEAGKMIDQGRLLDVQLMAEIEKQEDPTRDTSYFTFCLEHSHHDSDHMPGILKSKIQLPMLPISFPKEEEQEGDEEISNFYFACCAPACISTSTNSVLYNFPDDVDLAKSWLESCRRQDLLELLQEHGSMPGNMVLCSLHFSSGYFLSSSALVFNALPRAMPSVGPGRKTVASTHRKPERMRAARARLDSNPVKVVATEKLLQRPLPDSTTGAAHPVASSSEAPISSIRQRLRRRSEETLRRLAAFRELEDSDDAAAEPTPSDSFEEQQLRRKDETLRRLAACRETSFRRASREARSPEPVTRQRCCYVLCQHSDLPLVPFPRNSHRCLAWLLNIGYDHLPLRFLNSAVPPAASAFRLCVGHFEDSCFFSVPPRPGVVSSAFRELYGHAVPTVFSHASLRYPCQLTPVASQTRGCAHTACQELLSSGVGTVDDNWSGKSSLESRRSRQNSLASRNWLDTPSGESLSIEPMDLEDPTMSVEETFKMLDESIETLQREKKILAKALHLQSMKYCHVRRCYHSKKSRHNVAESSFYSEKQAMNFIKSKLSKSTYEFFSCQRLSLRPKGLRWGYDAIQIPTVANRCGFGIRETLFSLFQMPSRSTLYEYKSKIKKDPDKVPDNHIVKNDIKRVYHRKLTRRKKPMGPEKVSCILKRYVSKQTGEDPSL